MNACLVRILLPLTLVIGIGAARAPAVSDDERFFSQRIEPLLRQHCFACHSHAAGEMAGGLALDSRSGWATGGDQGPAIVPGKPDVSLLIRAVGRQDANLQMPPDDPLSQADIDLLTEWVRRGAVDPRQLAAKPHADHDPLDWWSLRPLQRPPLPTAPAGKTDSTGETDSPNPIDAFVRQRLVAAGLTAAPPADRRSLIRRLYFDLHGLPPRPQDVAAFVADPDPDAYERLVDRLLASPRYGERWARHWLDTIHFADSHGCEHDVYREHAWRYRDYVIDSLNHDTPWPRWIREQLAADWFFPDEPERTAALGFIAAGPLELSRASTAPTAFEYLDRDDMVTQTMAAFASSTANCARCHNHKFDPISQADYYALQAVFAGVGKGDVEYDTDPAVTQQRQHWNQLLAAADQRDATQLLSPDHAAIVERWEQTQRDQPAIWEPLSLADCQSANGVTLQLLDDHSLLSQGSRPETDTYTIVAPLRLPQLSSLRLDVLPDDRLPGKGPGRADSFNFHLSEFEALVWDAEHPEPRSLTFREATADFNQQGWTIAHAIDGNPDSAWGIHPQIGKPHHAVFVLDEPCQLHPDPQIKIVLKQLHGQGHLIGRFRMYATGAPAESVEWLPDAVLLALQIPAADRTESQRTDIAAHVLRHHAQQQLSALPPLQTVYGVSPNYSHGKKLAAAMTPKTVHVLRRGDFEKPGKAVAPGALSALESLNHHFRLADPQQEASRRAALADWLADADNPLTWRSVVNRVWAYHFGRGICDTPNDFGRMGGSPTHPQLLDWLAVWFRDDAQGSLKQLHRMIVLSQTYQQISHGSAADAESNLRWQMNRRQLDAESIRDSILQISGRIDLRMGGPGIQQFTQTPGAQLSPTLDYDAFDWSGPTAARRSIYRVVWRGNSDPFMEALDFPELGILTERRSWSVSALQALAVFNNDFVLHHSSVLAARLESQHSTLEAQVTAACREVYLREPTEFEQARLLDYAQSHGLAATCRILFNSNAFIFVD